MLDHVTCQGHCVTPRPIYEVCMRALSHPCLMPSPAMLWRLPASVRSFLEPASRACSCFSRSSSRSFSSSSGASVAPLRILFCGSDDFSIASLRALFRAQRETPNLIESIDVAHRPAKATGRGLKTLRQGDWVRFDAGNLI